MQHHTKTKKALKRVHFLIGTEKEIDS